MLVLKVVLLLVALVAGWIFLVTVWHACGLLPSEWPRITRTLLVAGVVGKMFDAAADAIKV
jgi:hypothetical protein